MAKWLQNRDLWIVTLLGLVVGTGLYGEAIADQAGTLFKGIRNGISAAAADLSPNVTPHNVPTPARLSEASVPPFCQSVELRYQGCRSACH